MLRTSRRMPLAATLIAFYTSVTAHSLAADCSPGASVLNGRRVLVTGGGRGIGKAIALICAAEGANVAIMSRTAAELKDVVAENASRLKADSKVFIPIVADVTDEVAVEQGVAAAVAALGGINLLINNAGGAGDGGKAPLFEQPIPALRRLLELNVVSVAAVSGAVLRQTMLESGGDIVMVSSRAGKIGIPSMGPYVTSKFALEGMAATLAAELKNKGVAVNTISPGMVDTSSFPKPAGRPGVRSAESTKDGLLTILENSIFAKVNGGATGQYLHVDELDEALLRGLPPKAALKSINEPLFAP